MFLRIIIEDNLVREQEEFLLFLFLLWWVRVYFMKNNQSIYIEKMIEMNLFIFKIRFHM